MPKNRVQLCFGKTTMFSKTTICLVKDNVVAYTFNCY